MATDTRNPTSDEAVSGTWTGTAGSRFTLVDDYPDTAGTDKLVHGTTAGNITFGFTAFAIPAGSVINSVQVLYYDDKNGSQACNVGGRLKVGGSYFNASTHNPANGVFNQRTDTWTSNPKTATSWTVDDVNSVGANALQAFGWSSTDASPSIDLTSIQVLVNYTSLTPTRGLVSFSELESPFVPTRGLVSWSETEVPLVPTRGYFSFSEFEVPTVLTRGYVSWVELETPSLTTPTRGLVSFTEFETPDLTPTRGLVSFVELEIPLVGTRGLVSVAEFESPFVFTRGLISFAEFESPDVGAVGDIDDHWFSSIWSPIGWR